MKKINWKLIGVFSLIIAILGALIAAVVFKAKAPYKPIFYNYSSYISENNKKEINKNFDYKEFAELTEFNRAISSNKALAGIGSDHQAVTLIRKNKLKKINYELIFGKGVTSPQNYLRPVIWKHLNSYDKYLINDINGKPFAKPRHLWEYFIPYYSQSQVIAFNFRKNNNIIPTFKPNSTHFEILQTLAKNGYKNLVITDSIRDNLMLGSTYLKQADGSHKNEFQIINGDLTTENYKNQVDSFLDLIKQSTNLDPKNPNQVLFKGDGSDVLQSMIDPKTNIQMGIMYNGDALDAYYSEDNFKDVKEGGIRIVNPKDGLLLVDGLVINSSVSNSEADDYLTKFQRVFFNGYQLTKFKIQNNKQVYDEKASVLAIEKIAKNKEEYDYELLPILSNFDFINYTPVYRNEYDFILKNYFDDDENAINIYKINPNIDYKSIKPISERLQTLMTSYYYTSTKS